MRSTTFIFIQISFLLTMTRVITSTQETMYKNTCNRRILVHVLDEHSAGLYNPIEINSSICPSLSQSCCSENNLESMKEVFEINAEKFKMFETMVIRNFKQIASIENTQMIKLCSDLANAKVFEGKEEEYQTFLDSYNFIKNNIDEIITKVKSSFTEIVNLNSQFACSLCIPSNDHSIVYNKNYKHLTDKLISSLNLNLSNCILKSTKSEILSQSETSSYFKMLYQIMQKFTEPYGSGDIDPSIFNDRKDSENILNFVNTAMASPNTFINDETTQRMCVNNMGLLKNPFKNQISNIIIFTIIMENTLLEENSQMSEEEMIEKHDRIYKKIYFDYFLEDSKNPNPFENIFIEITKDQGYVVRTEAMANLEIDYPAIDDHANDLNKKKAVKINIDDTSNNESQSSQSVEEVLNKVIQDSEIINLHKSFSSGNSQILQDKDEDIAFNQKTINKLII